MQVALPSRGSGSATREQADKRYKQNLSLLDSLLQETTDDPEPPRKPKRSPQTEHKPTPLTILRRDRSPEDTRTIAENRQFLQAQAHAHAQPNTVLDMHKPKYSPLGSSIQKASQKASQMANEVFQKQKTSIQQMRDKITASFYAKESQVNIELNPTEYMSRNQKIFGQIVDVGVGFGTGRHLAERKRSKQEQAGVPAPRKSKFNFTKNTKHMQMQTEDPGVRDPGNPVGFVLPIVRVAEFKLLKELKGDEKPRVPLGGEKIQTAAQKAEEEAIDWAGS